VPRPHLQLRLERLVLIHVGRPHRRERREPLLRALQLAAPPLDAALERGHRRRELARLRARAGKRVFHARDRFRCGGLDAGGVGRGATRERARASLGQRGLGREAVMQRRAGARHVRGEVAGAAGIEAVQRRRHVWRVGRVLAPGRGVGRGTCAGACRAGWVRAQGPKRAACPGPCRTSSGASALWLARSSRPVSLSSSRTAAPSAAYSRFRLSRSRALDSMTCCARGVRRRRTCTCLVSCQSRGRSARVAHP
jgi:hypothetical protein